MEKTMPDFNKMTITEKTMYIWKECGRDPNDAIEFIEKIEKKHGIEIGQLESKKSTYNGENLLKVPIEWTMKMKKLVEQFNVKELSKYSRISPYMLRKILNNDGKEKIIDNYYETCFNFFNKDIDELIEDINKFFYGNNYHVSEEGEIVDIMKSFKASSSVTNYYLNHKKIRNFILQKFKNSFKSFRELSRNAGYRERELSYIFQDLNRKGYTTKKRVEHLADIIGESIEYILTNFSEQNMKTA